MSTLQWRDSPKLPLFASQAPVSDKLGAMLSRPLDDQTNRARL